ncbi:MAG: phosphatidylserine/phosphatidylglycerophosphate/cardiolipin synthase family protein, partial [Deltaproteobacteria bacterium]
MNRFQRVFILIMVAASFLGCAHSSMVPPAQRQVAKQPSMSPLGPLSQGSRPAPVFGPPQEFAGSQPGELGRGGIFSAHSPSSNRIALLKNGDESFAARVQLLEDARKSIRIQALIFSGDEAGLHISEILKKKKADGLDVRVIVDAAANLGWQTQWMYFDLKQHG